MYIKYRGYFLGEHKIYSLLFSVDTGILHHNVVTLRITHCIPLLYNVYLFSIQS